MKDYHNTNHEQGATLARSKAGVRSQQDIILEYFELFPRHLFTPFQIRDNVLPDSPITSIRRAMTNLADADLLVKTATMAQGNHGKLNHTWRLNVQEEEQLDLFK